MWYTRRMTNALKKAVAEVERLPQSDQETIGRQMLLHVEKLRLLRNDIDKGLRSLNAGKGKPVEIREVLSRARRHAQKQ